MTHTFVAVCEKIIGPKSNDWFWQLGSASCNQASVISLVLCVCSCYDSHGP